MCSKPLALASMCARIVSRVYPSTTVVASVAKHTDKRIITVNRFEKNSPESLADPG